MRAPSRHAEGADYIMKLPKAEQKLPEWQTATETLIGAAEGRDFLMRARIRMQRALNRTGAGKSCRSPAMPNRRCRMHGGPSPGARKGAIRTLSSMGAIRLSRSGKGGRLQR
jgi:hypothetical protein